MLLTRPHQYSYKRPQWCCLKYISIAIEWEKISKQGNDFFLVHGTDFGCQVVVGLNEIFPATHNYVVAEGSIIGCSKKVFIADISILIPIDVPPSIEEGIRSCFSQLMGNHIDNRIHSSIAIGRRVLAYTTSTASGRRYSNGSILIISIVVVPATVIRAKAI